MCTTRKPTPRKGRGSAPSASCIEKYNFYNVVHHPFFDKDGGRVIYFEGTYTTAFIDGARPTPLYDYNQVMYKLSLDDPRLRLPASCPEQR